jgi:hypothetical protein
LKSNGETTKQSQQRALFSALLWGKGHRMTEVSFADIAIADAAIACWEQPAGHEAPGQMPGLEDGEADLEIGTSACGSDTVPDPPGRGRNPLSS